MKTTVKRSISVALAFTLLLGVLFSYTMAADNARAPLASATDKISEQLAAALNVAKDDELIPIYIWYADIDLDAIERATEKKLGYTENDIRAAESVIPALAEETFLLPDAEYATAVMKYLDDTRAVRRDVMVMQNEYTTVRRSLAKDAYIAYNEHQSSVAGIPGKAIDYTSEFTPVVVAELTPSEIATLEKKSNVVYLGYKPENKSEPEMVYAMPAIDADYVRNTLGFNGYGTKIGLYEAGRVGTHSELNSSSITRLDTSQSVSDHATVMARILVGSQGVAPGANLFSNSSSTSAEQGLEALVSKGVSAINVSQGLGGDRPSGNYYTDFERWIDHLAYQHSVTLVKSAGNGGLSSTVTLPGLAHNVITVGSIKPMFTVTKADDLFDTNTSTANGNTDGCAKPDVLAPGELLGTGGTSCAAPMVTGVIAQMIEYKPSIATDPALIKAILTACTERKLPTVAGGTSAEAYEGNITAQQGAGVINAKRAILILSGGKYASGSMSTGTVTRTFSVPSGNTYIRYAVAWIRNNQATAPGHGTIAATAGIAANLKLEVYRPSGALAASGNITNSSVELVHYQVNSIFGTYSAKITRMDSGTNSFKYAVAWY